MKNRLVICAVFLISAFTLGAETFEFKYWEGEKYRILSEVEEDVLVNDRYSHTASILNKIAIQVTEAEEGAGKISARFITSEKTSGYGGVYEWSEAYDSVFWRNRLGEYEIEDRYFMPVVRNVPRFPERDIAKGETWSASGWEVHDFRKNFNMPDPFSFPIQVSYSYEGEVKKDGLDLHAIDIDYTIFHKNRTVYPGLGLYPVLLSGYSKQKLLWDNRAGKPHSYEEEFNFIFFMSNGETVEYRGTARASVLESENLNRVQVAEDIRRELEGKGYRDTGVRVDEEGVTISLENIQFRPDSAVLLDSEKKKLLAIADILRNYPDRDLMITGHTALAGTAAGRQILSEQRAAAVAQFLLSTGVKGEEQIMTRGMGATRPIADNSTEAGMKRNRRVEITIMEN